MSNELANVHMILALSAQERGGKPKEDVVHIRMEPELKELADKIIKTNGSTMSAYLRKCCETLVREYVEG